MAETPDRLVTVAQYDAEIERLQKGRDAAEAVIGDDVQKDRRHRRRALLAGIRIHKKGFGSQSPLHGVN